MTETETEKAVGVIIKDLEALTLLNSRFNSVFLRPKETDEGNERRFDGDIIAARSALLDFYGDYAVSFSSQFVASIFGLITACALINVVLSSIGSKINVFSASIIIFSILIFIGFTSAARHTYSRFKYYSDLASQIVSSQNCLRGAAQLNEIKVNFKIPNDKKSIQNLEQTYLKFKENLPENYKTLIQESKPLNAPFPIFEEISRFNQNKQTAKKILDSRYLPIVMVLAVVSLSLITYYPLITSFLKIA